MSDFLADVENEQRGAVGPTCNVALLLAAVDPALAAQIVTALSDEKVHASAIWRALDKRRDDIDAKVPQASTLRRHRSGQCSCDR